MKICIYGSSSDFIDKTYIEETEKLCRRLAEDGHGLVFGGGAHGLMGASARGFYEKNAEIIGVSPKFFDVDGVLFEHCTKLVMTETMRERKKAMEDFSDAFIVLPGGIGTFDEFFEIITLRQLKRHGKPIAIYNINGYYEMMMKFIENAVNNNFVKKASCDLFRLCNTEDEVVEYFKGYVPPSYGINELRYTE